MISEKMLRDTKMDEYILRNDISYYIIETEERCHNDRWTETHEVAYKTEIEQIPAADVVPVRHGKWIEEDDSCCGFHATDIVCSECNKISEFGKFSYCPNCGARMDL